MPLRFSCPAALISISTPTTCLTIHLCTLWPTSSCPTEFTIFFVLLLMRHDWLGQLLALCEVFAWPCEGPCKTAWTRYASSAVGGRRQKRSTSGGGGRQQSAEQAKGQMQGRPMGGGSRSAYCHHKCGQSCEFSSCDSLKF